MTFHYIGKYKGEESLIAKRETKESDVRFKEPELKAFAILANALTQMPKGAMTFMSGMHSYWYIPDLESKRI